MNNKRDLIRRCMWSIFILLIVEVGRQLVIPVVDISSAEALLQKTERYSSSGTLLVGKCRCRPCFHWELRRT